MRGPILPSVPQRRLPEPRRNHTKPSQTLQQSLAPWTTFWRTAFVLLSDDWELSSMSLKIGAWTKYYFSISFCLLTLLNPVSSWKSTEFWLSSHQDHGMFGSIPSNVFPKDQFTMSCGLRKKKKTHYYFLPKFFFVLILWAIRIVSVALQLGSIQLSAAAVPKAIYVYVWVVM